MSKTFIIRGENICDLETLYREFNRIFMENEDWQIGQSLDAFNDLLYGGFGMIPAGEPIELIWENFEQNRHIFDKTFTIQWYEQKLKPDRTYNTKWVNEQLALLCSGEGQTYFDILLEIIGEHKNIKLIPA